MHIVLNRMHLPHQGLWYISVAKGLAAAESQCLGHTLLGLSVQMPHLNSELKFLIAGNVKHEPYNSFFYDCPLCGGDQATSEGASCGELQSSLCLEHTCAPITC